MEAYRYQELAYLIVPIMLGIEFFLTARSERSGAGEVPVGAYVLDFFGFVFCALIPAVFIFTILAIEGGYFSFGKDTPARFDRYVVMFFFMGAWWQVYMLTALRVRRMCRLHQSEWYVWIPYIVLGVFISLLVLWVSPWNLKWISVAWFIFIFLALKVFRISAKNVERVFWLLAAVTFFMENLMFLWLETIV